MQTPKTGCKQYKPDVFNPATPRAMPFPSGVEPACILNHKEFVLGPHDHSVALLITVPITKDKEREKREIQDQILILKSMGFKRAEVIREATFKLCQKAINARIRLKNNTGEVIDTLGIYMASHGTGNASDRLNIYLHDGSELDSKMLAQWAFDFRAKNTFFIMLTCFAEKFVHTNSYPDGTRGGVIWASAHDKKAHLKTYKVTYPDGTHVDEYHDSFTRALFEILFCLKDLTELEHPITFTRFCQMIQSAHSTADSESSSGFSPQWNGKEVPLLFFNQDFRQNILHKGTTGDLIVLKPNNDIDFEALPVPGRSSGGRSAITDVLQKQIDNREISFSGTPVLPPFNLSAERDSDFAEADTILLSEVPQTESDGEDSSSSESEAESETESGLELEPQPETDSEADSDDEVDLNSLEGSAREAEEARRVALFNSQHPGWKCRAKCLKCGRRLVAPNKSTTSDHRALFGKLGLLYYALPSRPERKSCGIVCQPY